MYLVWNVCSPSSLTNHGKLQAKSKYYRQAGAELSQAQLKLRLDFNQIKYTFRLSLFDLVDLVGWALNFKLD